MSPSAPSENPIEVAAGLVFREGKLLIARRPSGAHLGGLWEFPGGKREPGETFEQCLHRELAEELGIEVRVNGLFAEIQHDYPDRSVLLKFFVCQWLRHEPQPKGCEALEWVAAGELTRHPFPAADARLLDRLLQSRELW